MTPSLGLVDKIQTVLGILAPEELGITLTHEHLLIDTSHLTPLHADGDERSKLFAPVTIEVLGFLRYGRGWNLDNARLTDLRASTEELMLYKRAGGSSLVEVTSRGIGRNPRGLADIARATGLNIIMGSSYYVDSSHPAQVSDTSEDAIVNEIAGDIFNGVDGTGVRAGVIGEVGCSFPLTVDERKVLRASGRAQKLTGAPLLIHPGRDEAAPMEIIEILNGVGADITRTVVSHLDRTFFNKGMLRRLADTGCMLSYDMFGVENSFYASAPRIDMPNDAERLRWLAWLAAEGCGNQLLIAHDIDKKYRLVRYGGHGYAHILENIVPRMRSRGFSEQLIHQVLVENPRRLLTFASSGSNGTDRYAASARN